MTFFLLIHICTEWGLVIWSGIYNLLVVLLCIQFLTIYQCFRKNRYIEIFSVCKASKASHCLSTGIKTKSTGLTHTHKKKFPVWANLYGLLSTLLSVMITCNDGPILTLQNQVLANSPGKRSHMLRDGFSLI